MYTHGIGIDDVVAAAVAELHKTVLLLKKAEQKAYSYADDGPSEGYQAAFEQENARDGAVAGSEEAQGGYIVALVDDEIRQC